MCPFVWVNFLLETYNVEIGFVKIKKYKESNIFGDVLSTIMREDKTKKRRLSDIKAEKEAKVGIFFGLSVFGDGGDC